MLVQSIAPLAPFFAEEAWTKLGGAGSVHSTDWPQVDPELLKDETVEISVQVNGKLRGSITVAKTETKEALEQLALQQPCVQKYIEDNMTVRKVIVVPNKLINVVVG